MTLISLNANVITVPCVIRCKPNCFEWYVVLNVVCCNKWTSKVMASSHKINAKFNRDTETAFGRTADKI